MAFYGGFELEEPQRAGWRLQRDNGCWSFSLLLCNGAALLSCQPLYISSHMTEGRRGYEAQT